MKSACMEMNSGRINDLFAIIGTLHLRKEIVGDIFQDLYTVMQSLKMTPIVQENVPPLCKWDLVKLKRFSIAKKTTECGCSLHNGIIVFNFDENCCVIIFFYEL